MCYKYLSNILVYALVIPPYKINGEIGFLTCLLDCLLAWYVTHYINESCLSVDQHYIEYMNSPYVLTRKDKSSHTIVWKKIPIVQYQHNHYKPNMLLL